VSFDPFSAVAAKIYAGLLGGVLAIAAVQTVRIEGLWFIDGLQQLLADERAALKSERDGREEDREGWEQQVADAVAAKARAERKSQEIATDAQTTHDALQADNAGLRAYLAANRLRSETGGPAVPGTAPDYGTGLPAGTTAGALVAASEADLIRCDASYVYATSAYDWAAGLIASGLAVTGAPKP